MYPTALERIILLVESEEERETATANVFFFFFFFFLYSQTDKRRKRIHPLISLNPSHGSCTARAHGADIIPVYSITCSQTRAVSQRCCIGKMGISAPRSTAVGKDTA
jgi:hypothetical protein